MLFCKLESIIIKIKIILSKSIIYIVDLPSKKFKLLDEMVYNLVLKLKFCKILCSNPPAYIYFFHLYLIAYCSNRSPIYFDSKR